ncbi:RnfABCDGE type electron transport complex subunit D [Halochromatium glycolicum]|uniref:Ion-translocating oxidoreductase complex subunit D n=1 Tax=Halochromatium glycolicum TaxID=85075 RepID=A0AAJ0X8N2_9GAMM|nr:RnfABCDGE type electron transport complex subunit D [Halochromatium glycolicum]MBK1704046.1 electron transporter RnfD [Halochromatium glycolicum]
MPQSDLFASPHAHAPVSIGRSMRLVMLALLPATLLGIGLFGWPAILLFLGTLIAALLFEASALVLAGKPVRAGLFDGSALLTGWLLALTLPPWAPWWIGVLGAFIAIVIGKQVFGGIGQNLFNPAMVARVALLVSFPLEMTQWVAPQPLFSAQTPGLFEAVGLSLAGLAPPWDAMTGASILGELGTELQRGGDLTAVETGSFTSVEAMVGTIPGSLGETSALLLLLGGLFLIRKGVIGWVIPTAVLLGVLVPASLLHLLDATRFAAPLVHLTAGATLLTAFFIATDPVTSPVSRAGQAVFGVGIGLLIYLIRTFGAYPEGAAFAVLLMNAATPMIDHYLKPRIFGRDRRGKPLPVPEDALPADAAGERASGSRR